MTGIQLGTFHPFPLLPKELRLEIWELALPDPRVIELSLIRSDDPSRLPRRYRRTSRGPWAWIATASPITISLIHINAEVRSCALASYELCEIPNQSDSTRHPLCINYSKDTIFITRHTEDNLREVLVGNPIGVRFTNWRSKLRNLAIPLAVLSKPRYPPAVLIPGPEPADPNGFDEATRYLDTTIRTFPNLKDLSLVIDGRNSGFDGDAEIVESTSQHEDYEVPEGRKLASSWIPEVLDRMQREESSEIRLPSVRLALLANGEETPELQRRWNYLRARCRVCHPNCTDLERESTWPWPHVSASRFFTPYSSSEESSSDDDEEDAAVAEDAEDQIAGSGSDRAGGSQRVIGSLFHRDYNYSSDDEDGPRYAYPSLQSERWSHF